jgi:hypothetical protein
MPGAWPPGRILPVVARDVDRTPRHRRAELGRRDHLGVERLRLGLGAELPEQNAREQQRVRRGRLPSPLGRERHPVPGAREQLPRHGDLGHVEVAIGERDEDVHHPCGGQKTVGSA